MTVQFYHYPRCSTCRKARAWLDAHDVGYEAVDIVERPPTVEVLQQVLTTSGLPVKKLFNTSGEVYRQEGYKEKLPTLSEKAALAALAGDGKLIKRPLLIAANTALVGFDEAQYAAQWRAVSGT